MRIGVGDAKQVQCRTVQPLTVLPDDAAFGEPCPRSGGSFVNVLAPVAKVDSCQI